MLLLCSLSMYSCIETEITDKYAPENYETSGAIFEDNEWVLGSAPAGAVTGRVWAGPNGEVSVDNYYWRQQKTILLFLPMDWNAYRFSSANAVLPSTEVPVTISASRTDQPFPTIYTPAADPRDLPTTVGVLDTTYPYKPEHKSLSMSIYSQNALPRFWAILRDWRTTISQTLRYGSTPLDGTEIEPGIVVEMIDQRTPPADTLYGYSQRPDKGQSSPYVHIIAVKIRTDSLFTEMRTTNTNNFSFTYTAYDETVVNVSVPGTFFNF